VNDGLRLALDSAQVTSPFVPARPFLGQIQHGTGRLLFPIDEEDGPLGMIAVQASVNNDTV
jgi:hypothetical protein